MVLRNIENINPTTSLPKQKSPSRQRIISESTGLVRFNIKPNVQQQQNNDLNEKFATLEKQAQNETNIALSPKRGINLQAATSSPQQISRMKEYESSKVQNNDSLILLASKQREILELKFQMNKLKEKLQQSENELHELEKKCSPNFLVQSSSQVSSQSSEVSKLNQPLINNNQSSNNMNNNFNHNFSTLKKKISISQLQNKPSLMKFQEDLNANFNKFQNNQSLMKIQEDINVNFNKFQKDTNILIGRGLRFVNNIKNDIFHEENTHSLINETLEDEYHSDSDHSDYGGADISDYALPVK
ncbi:hypothetical protein WICMUC_005605 [Wickerhamomyces mucosus]|uniref:Uncharacterized protein n=1 Tax=Wickerhamomyces mucosus TaxID=1378264 RepID=A0A9P8T655_9ASCO|nr:hypothetical protein WICMUC_005605 [Wickerhamomyces mucosus]